MNKSGTAVREIMDYWGILNSEIVVILDDVAVSYTHLTLPTTPYV